MEKTMKKIWRPLVIISLAIFLGYNLYLDLQDKPTADAAEISDIPVGISKGELAPEFEGITLDGETFRLSDTRGKTVFLNLFASWCGPCQLEAPHIAQVFAGQDRHRKLKVGTSVIDLYEFNTQACALRVKTRGVIPSCRTFSS